MPMISFTQYFRPEGRGEEVSFDRPQEICDLVAAIEADDRLLEIEVLATGYVRAMIHDPFGGEDGTGADVAAEIAMNEDQREDNQTIAGDAAMMAIDNLIRNYKPKQKPEGFDGDGDAEEFKPA